MAARNLASQYRLRRLAIQLREFTVGDLETAAGVSPETVHNFLHELRQVNAGFIGKESVGREGPGRPALRYRLSPEAVEFLAAKNLEIAKELNEDDSIARPAAVAAAGARAGQAHSFVPLQGSPEPAVVFAAFEPELRTLSRLGASVLWMKPGMPSSVRTACEVRTLEQPIHTVDKLRKIAGKILTPWQKDLLGSKGSVKCAYDLPELGRAGVNIHLVSGKLQIELRLLPRDIPSFEDLHLPPAVAEFSKVQSGLILVAGIGGSGRSRTLAALLDRINETRKCLVATIEEPMLYAFEQKQCFFEQRQVGIDTPDFGTALTDSLEERVDVLLISDIDDPKTFATALAAADRTLILCRVTAPSSVEAIEKLIELSTPAEQARVRVRLATSLVAVIGLTAVPKVGGKGFVYAAEVLRMDNTTRDLIQDETKIHRLPEYLREHDLGSQTFEMAIERLSNQHLISDEWVAQRLARYPQSRTRY
jgi:twitching motility protein PilT